MNPAVSTLSVKAPQTAGGKPRIPVFVRDYCSACGGKSLETLLDLPQFPLTGIFVEPEQADRFPKFDQALIRCTSCEHVQLKNSIDPEFLYQETYTHRSSQSPVSSQGNDFFYRFLKRVTGNQRFKCVAEIGCNDLYLLKKLEADADTLVGFDPIWKSVPDRTVGGIQVKGRYIEEIRPESDIGSRPDLVISVHTLEHVENPLEGLRPVFDFAAPGALFAIEIPGFDSLVNAARFDQVFHQHLNYFSVASVQAMIRQLGGEYVVHEFNYGYWQGTMMVAFRKPTHASRGTASAGPTALAAPTVAEIGQRFAQFKSQLSNLESSIEHLMNRGVPIYGFGAAQMIPSLAYHFDDSSLSFLECVFDDNTAKNGLMYPGFQPRIVAPVDAAKLRDGAVWITAADSVRPLLAKLTALQPRHILYPFSVL